MADDEKLLQPEQVQNIYTLAAFAFQKLGMATISLVTFGVVWYMAIGPEQLTRSRDAMEMREAAKEMRAAMIEVDKVAASLERTADHQKTATTVLDRFMVNVLDATTGSP